MSSAATTGMRLVALLAVVALLTGGLLHALIPHDDGDNHGDNLSIIEGSLHSAIQHEEKKVFVLMAGLWLFTLFIVRRNMTGEYILLFSTTAIPFLRTPDPQLLEVRRGTVAYRKFG